MSLNSLKRIVIKLFVVKQHVVEAEPNLLLCKTREWVVFLDSNLLFAYPFVNTPSNHKRLLKHAGSHSLDVPGFQHKAVPDGLPATSNDDDGLAQTQVELTMFLLANFYDSFLDLVAGLETPPTCIISDGFMTFSNIKNAAEKLKIPIMLYWTMAACGFMAYYQAKVLSEKGLVPLKAWIQRVSETELKLLSQHVQLVNTVLSATLNGRLLYVTDRPTIIFGADVTHPQLGEDSSPSIAVVRILEETVRKLQDDNEQMRSREIEMQVQLQ